MITTLEILKRLGVNPSPGRRWLLCTLCPVLRFRWFFCLLLLGVVRRGGSEGYLCLGDWYEASPGEFRQHAIAGAGKKVS